jgi:hypothetical protein
MAFNTSAAYMLMSQWGLMSFIYFKGPFGSPELNQFPRITFLEIEFPRIESIGNQFTSNVLVWLYTELIS